LKVRDERGYLIVAQSTDTQDYLVCARALAKSIRWFMPNAKICLLGNHDDDLFDYCIKLPYGDKGGWANDWQVFRSSPFRQTIKLEADMILNGSIEHWWTTFQNHDVVVAHHSQNFYGQETKIRDYRKWFDTNQLPDVYNAITYWRLSETAKEFFDLIRELFENWDQVIENVKGWDCWQADTDTAYAVAIKMLGPEKFLLPYQGPQFAHMKGKINFCDKTDWTKELVWELNEQGLRINSIQQTVPTHYYIKELAPILEEHYDKLLESHKQSR